ncbi:hypothetical protein P389DRAFT_65356 [Cystobasidium minutum MCA 4210]|uniref:uncharacterized protein n=1 Tax=Cystobasidium minutum MCA 4210 TaxID=1397322 RepID=UPI0034CF6C0E|eukprot:jgi/Rhomi1/65356/CE65355_1942
MFKSILLTSVVAALASVVSADGPGRDELVARQPYTNAEAFARGLPPLRPRHGRGSRTWTAVKRQQSAGLRSPILKFDNLAGSDGPIPNPYQGLDLGCVYGSCGYARASDYPSWTAHSSPNSMYFYDNGFPTFKTAASGGMVQLKSLYCNHAQGNTPTQLLVTGTTGEQTVFTETITCTQNGPEGTTDGPTYNVFPDLPFVDSLAFFVEDVTNNDGWTLDDIYINTVYA